MGEKLTQRTEIFSTNDNDIMHVVQGGASRYAQKTALFNGNQTITGEKTFSTGVKLGAGTDLLSDYEEGTWTPIIEGSTIAGVGTYTSQNGYYTRIGDTVFLNCIVGIVAHTGTGDIYIKGIPFVSQSSTNNISIGSAVPSNLTYTGNGISSRILSNDNKIVLLQHSSGAPASLVPIDTLFDLYVSIAYKV